MRHVGLHSGLEGGNSCRPSVGAVERQLGFRRAFSCLWLWRKQAEESALLCSTVMHKAWMKIVCRECLGAIMCPIYVCNIKSIHWRDFKMAKQSQKPTAYVV